VVYVKHGEVQSRVLVGISRYTTINFLQFSDNVIYLRAGGGVLRPTPLDEIPDSIRHTPSIRRSFWPLTCQDSSTCTIIVIVRKDWGPCVNLMHSIVQGQPLLSLRTERRLKGYLKSSAREGIYVTFRRPPELLASVKKFRSHKFWAAHSDSRIRHRHVSKVCKSEVNNCCFPVAANKYVHLDKQSLSKSAEMLVEIAHPFQIAMAHPSRV
jgi:hypothetical protein